MFNLENVIDIMSGHMTSEIVYRHAAPFRMVSHAFHSLGINRVNKRRLASRNNRNISKASWTFHEP